MFKTFVAILVIYFISALSKDPVDKHAVMQPAQTVSPDMMKLLATAKKYTSFEGPIGMPEVNEVSQRKLEAMYCGNQPHCPISALYIQGRVYYSNKLDMQDLLSRSILLHEFVHHIQNERVGPTYDCNMWREKEIEAYKIQAQYLRKHGLNGFCLRI